MARSPPGPPAAQQILDFWFNGIEDGWGTEQNVRRWFMSSAELDQEIAVRFGDTVRELANGLYREWIVTPHSGLAAVIAMDQFPRNMFRGTARAFACDPYALESTLHLIESGAEGALLPAHRLFLYMPLEHSEDLKMQNMSVSKFEQIAKEAPESRRETAGSNYDYAVRHRDIIVRFGRFPHRNEILGREPTEEETVYLTAGGETFGQLGKTSP